MGGKLVARVSFIYLDIFLLQIINESILSSDLIVTTISTMDTKKVRRLQIIIIIFSNCIYRVTVSPEHMKRVLFTIRISSSL